MKIALIAAATEQRNKIFPQHILDKLAARGELAVNAGGNTPEDIKPVMKDADVAITSWGSPHITREYLDEAPALKLIIHAAGTVSPIVDDEIWRRGIRVISSSLAIGQGVAETALALALSASKDFYRLNNQVHAGCWRENVDRTVVDMVDITFGVIGAGMVGRHLLGLLKCYDIDVVVYDPYVSEEVCASLGARKVELEELLRVSDIVSVHAPSIPETDHMLNADTLKLMKKDAGLVNTARGSIIDEQALYEHMAAGNLRFACLDVTNPEPPAFENPLRKLNNVIMLPHIAGVVNNGLARIGRHVIREMDRFIGGEPSQNEITEAMMVRVGKS